MTKKNIQKLKTMFDHKDGVSQTQAALQFKQNIKNKVFNQAEQEEENSIENF